MPILTDNDPMPCGKYEGEKMANVPADYLYWVHVNDKLPHEKGVRAYISDNLEVIEKEAKR